MRSFFFIPSDKEKFLENISNISSDEFVIDFEDSINQENTSLALNNLIRFNVSKKYWIRVPNPKYSFNKFSKLILDKIITNYDNIVIPKIRTKDDRDELINYIIEKKENHNDLKIILLIENPLILMDLYNIANLNLIYGIGIGSHDYCDEMSMVHTKDNLNYLRSFSLNVARSLKIKAIDFPSMNVKDYISYKDEVIDSINFGFDGKFIVHPWQLSVFQECCSSSNENEMFVNKVKSFIESIGGIKNFTVAVIDGVIVERPHLRRILNDNNLFNYD